jgi:hypothetical protein
MATTGTELASLFLTSSRNTLFNEHWPRLKACVEPLTVDQIWWRPNEASNSVGNLILHLNGNVTQWIVSSFNRDEDKRERPAEFSAVGGLTATELLERLGVTLNEAAKVLDRLTVDELLAPYEIQGYKAPSTTLSTTSASTLARLSILPKSLLARIWVSIKSSIKQAAHRKGAALMLRSTGCGYPGNPL